MQHPLKSDEEIKRERTFDRLMVTTEYLWLGSKPPEITRLSKIYGQTFHVYADDFTIVGHGRTREEADAMVSIKHPEIKEYERFVFNENFYPPIFVLIDPIDEKPLPKTEDEYQLENDRRCAKQADKVAKTATLLHASLLGEQAFVAATGSPHERLTKVSHAFSKAFIGDNVLSDKFKADLTGILIDSYRRDLSL